MSRTALVRNTKNLIVAVVILIAIAGGITGAVIANSPSHKVGVQLNAQRQVSYISYNGVNGVDALTLLKKHAQVGIRHYSFGDFVTSIDGTPGNGPKYWTFYVNGKEAQVGAGSYTTKNGDKLEWKLQ